MATPKPAVTFMPLTVVMVLLSAATMVAIHRASENGWLAFFSLIPLIQVIRRYSPRVSASLGAVWGLGVASMLALGDVSTAHLSPLNIALLVGIPAAYTGLFSAITRRIGFNPFVLAVGWMLVELSLRPVGLPLGLLAGAIGSGALVSWVGGLLGYVFVAFLVIWANAAIVSLLSRACLRISLPRIRKSTLDLARSLPILVAFSPPKNFSICEARPRAPPAR